MRRCNSTTLTFTLLMCIAGVATCLIVTNRLSESADRYLIVHNIGAGTRIEDVMFAWTIKGHYRFF
ncbi:MAG TPA: DUF1287 domain-containing protein [Pyrinomonadaceae bacterium]|nr:DUF1287 domain-containing protein [Pyrinomonadaceae bacterium]